MGQDINAELVPSIGIAAVGVGMGYRFILRDFSARFEAFTPFSSAPR
jgi:hypothetical protein